MIRRVSFLHDQVVVPVNIDDRMDEGTEDSWGWCNDQDIWDRIVVPQVS